MIVLLRRKTGLVCTRWSNRIAKSISFEYGGEDPYRKVHFHLLASMHFSVVLYLKARNFQKYRNVLFSSFIRKCFRFYVPVGYTWCFFKCALHSIRKKKIKAKWFCKNLFYWPPPTSSPEFLLQRTSKFSDLFLQQKWKSKPGIPPKHPYSMGMPSLNIWVYGLCTVYCKCWYCSGPV